MKAFVLIILSAALLDLTAATITAKCTFERRTPTIGVIYVSSDSSAAVADLTVSQKNKEFSQNVVFAPKGSKVTFTNEDTVQHNIFANDQAQGAVFDLGMGDPASALNQTIDWEDGAFVRLGCRIHPKMMCWVGSIASAYAAAVAFDTGAKSGSASIAEVPAGEHTVTLWIPAYDPVEVRVVAGAPIEAPITRKGRPQGTFTITME